MSLLVTVIKAPESVVVTESSRQFSTEGGTIGRGAENSWPLEDPDLYLSSLHCQFVFENGQYYLVDQSTNGTFYNGSPDPMGKGSRLPVSDKDQFIIGDYHFSISVRDQAAAAASIPSDPFAMPTSANSLDGFASSPFDGGIVGSKDPLFNQENADIDPLAALDKARDGSAPDSGGVAGLNVDPFANTSPSSPVDPLAQQLDWPVATPAGQVSGSASGSVIPDDWDSDSETESIQPPVVPQPQQAPSPPIQSQPIAEPPVQKPIASAQGSATAVDTTFINALGLGDRNLSEAEIGRINQLAGEVLREMVAGIMQVLGSRSAIKNEFRMNVTTIQPVENNPLKFSANVDDALENMFLKSGNSYKQPVEAVREGFEGVAEHQVAILAGIREAFKGVIERFDPLILEERFAKLNKGGILSGSHKAKNWESFSSYYEELVGDVDKSFQHLFGDGFVRAYEDQLQKLAISRKSKTKIQDTS